MRAATADLAETVAVMAVATAAVVMIGAHAVTVATATIAGPAAIVIVDPEVKDVAIADRAPSASPAKTAITGPSPNSRRRF